MKGNLDTVGVFESMIKPVASVQLMGWGREKLMGWWLRTVGGCADAASSSRWLAELARMVGMVGMVALVELVAFVALVAAKWWTNCC